MQLSTRSTRRLAYALVLLTAFVASLPMFMSYVPHPGHDLAFHLYRIEGIAQGLSEGQFPVRMNMTKLMGYGYPVGICYGDAFLYIPALLRLAGVPLDTAYRAFVVLVNLFTAAITYHTFAKMLQNRGVGVAASALWTLSYYRLLDVYVRAAIGEYLCFAMFPLLMYGFYSIVLHTRPGASPRGWLWMALGIAGVVLSHVLSVVIALVVLVPLGAVALIWKRELRIAAHAALAIVAGAALSLCFLVPFYSYYTSAGLAVNALSTQFISERAARNVVEPAQLFMAFTTLKGFSKPMAEGIAEEMPLEVGWGILVFAFLALLALLTREWRRTLTAERRRWTLATLALAAVCFWITTALFPWGAQTGLVGKLVGVLGSVQYPWRFIGAGSYLLIVAGAIVFASALDGSGEPGVEHAAGEQRAHHAEQPARHAGQATAEAEQPASASALLAQLRRLPAVAAVCLSVCLAFVEAGVGLSTYMVTQDEAWDVATLLDQGDGRYGIASGEYLRTTTDRERLFAEMTTEPKATGGVSVEAYARTGTTRTLTVSARAGAGTVELPMLWYPNYRVSVAEGTGAGASQGQGSAVELYEGDNGKATLRLAAGFEGRVKVTYELPVMWRVADAASLAAWICVGVYAAFGYHRGHKGMKKGSASRQNAAARDKKLRDERCKPAGKRFKCAE